MTSTINTAPLESLWLPHTDDVPLVLTGRMRHIADPQQTITVVFDADRDGFWWRGTDSSRDDWVVPDDGTATTTLDAVMAASDPENRPLVSMRTMLATCAALDDLALAWRLRSHGVADQAAETSLRVMPLHRDHALWLVASPNGYVHTAVREPSTGALHVDVEPGRTVAGALAQRPSDDTALASALTGDRDADPQAVAAAGWRSPAHAALAFLHTRCPQPLRYRGLMHSDPVTARILGEGFLSILRK
jgi:hypothetical protein